MGVNLEKNAVLDLSKMDADAVKALVAQVNALQQAEAEAVKAAAKERDTRERATSAKVGALVLEEYLPDGLTTFKSTAQGFLIAGTKFEHEGVEYTIGSILVRVTSTIPAKEK